MKNRFSFFVILFSLFLGCGSNDPASSEPPPSTGEVYLSVNPSECAIPINGGVQNLTVISNTNWAVSSNAEWCVCSPQSGIAGSSSISVTSAANYTGAARSAELTFTADSVSKKCSISQDGEISLSVSPSEISIQADGTMQKITVTTNTDWTVSSNAEWCSCSPTSGTMGGGNVLITATANYTGTTRSAELTFTAGSTSKKCTVQQESTQMPSYVPNGYSLVWQDEFEGFRMPDTQKWWYETGAGGWGNHEIENYIAGFAGTDTCALIYGGSLKIMAKKVGSQVYSIRMNTSESWTYGYFEARLKLPSGRGTWPAFWMMPKNFTTWPGDGEIDIMEEVGFRPNWVSSSIHCNAYNHAIGTQKTAETFVATAESDFHVYAVEWTQDYIRGFVDGKQYFEFLNDNTENKNTWPFNAPFYLKLNLAWGGDWGGAQGVDESALPATYEIDYVRVYQKK
ncbi:MAG: family 16 glycosylhydrolase [Candidatus Azobacteroides sp.]|nr:family 16 glycosylhydrolase [Candidatus Azobacteroides sp.]